jgi:hypothetical protein
VYRLFRRFSNFIYRHTQKLGYPITLWLPFYISKHRYRGQVEPGAWLIERGWYFGFRKYAEDMSLSFLYDWVLSLGPIRITRIQPKWRNHAK